MAEDKSGPFFSIIVPTYNRQSRIRIAIKSILRQTYDDFEVIIVDDGSTDNTQQVITELFQTDSRVKYYHKVNEERSIARNFGIAHAKGKYINFLDSDDIMYPKHLYAANNLLKNNDYPEVGHLGFEIIDERGNVKLKRNNFCDNFKPQLIHENILHGNAIFIRRDIAQKINFIPSKDAILSEDWYLWLRLAARFPFHFDNTVTSAVLEHPGRSLLNIDPDKLIASTNVLVEHLKKDDVFIREYKGKVSRHFANHFTFLSLILSLTKARRWETLRFLATAVSYDPFIIFSRRFLAALKHTII